MLEFEILVKGNFGEDSLAHNYDPVKGRMPRSPAVVESIKKNWPMHVRWARNNSLSVRNEEMLRLVDYEASPDMDLMTLHLGVTDYKEFVATRDRNLASKIQRSFCSNPLGASAVIVTSDNKILCGLRPPNSNMNPNRYFLIGGFLTPKDASIGISLFDGIKREIHEETGIVKSAHYKTKCVGLVYDLIKPHPELCFSTYVHENYETIRRYSPADYEVVQLEALDNTQEAIASWMLALHPERIVGTGEGCLLLHGLQLFGQHWFDDILSRLEAVS